MSILFTCAGRRNYLLEYFRKAMGNKGELIAADMQRSAPAMAVADKAIVVPEVFAPGYVEVILDICIREKVRAVISLNDLELPLLSRNRERFEAIGVTLIVSTEDVISLCFDKYKTFRFGRDLGIELPKTFLKLEEAKNALDSGEMSYPVVVKPRWGSASIGIEFPGNREELELSYRLTSLKITRSILYEASKLHLDEAVMIQEMIGGTEYGVDILNDFSGKTVQVYVKEKLAMRAGETDKAVLRDKPGLEELGYRIGNAAGHIGNMDCDLFERDGNYLLLEMNPRFGGGYPFSHLAGADYPSAILAWLEEKPFDFGSFSRIYDVPYAKCDTLIKILS